MQIGDRTYFSKNRYCVKNNIYSDYYRGKAHFRKTGPNEIYFDETGVLYYWMVDLKIHRIDGPGRIDVGIIKYNLWYFKGIKYTEEAYWNK